MPKPLFLLCNIVSAKIRYENGRPKRVRKTSPWNQVYKKRPLPGGRKWTLDHFAAPKPEKT